MNYEIEGNSMQVLKLTLQNGESVYADSGKLVSKSENVAMTPRLVGGIIKALERKVTGATGMLTEFKAGGDSATLSVAGIMPGKIKAMELGAGESFIAEHDAFLAAGSGVDFTAQTVGIGPAFFGGAGFVLQKFKGPGNVFMHVSGDILEYELDGTTALEVDPGHIAGFDDSLSYKIRFVDNIRSAMFGCVGLFLAKFEGKGRVILHSVSRYKLSSAIYTQGLAETQGKK